MKVIRKHNTTKEVAMEKVEGLVPGLMQQYGDPGSNPSHTWKGDVMEFSIQSRGFSIKGRVQVSDTEAVIDIDIPFLLRPLEGMIRSGVERVVDEVFPPGAG